MSLYDGSRAGVHPSVHLFVCPCMHLLTLSNMNISEPSMPIKIKFYLKHHWSLGGAALGFGPDRIGTLVSMAMDSSRRVLMVKILLAL